MRLNNYASIRFEVGLHWNRHKFNMKADMKIRVMDDLIDLVVELQC